MCIKEVHNPYSEVYLSYVLRKNVEKLVLESGYKIYCGEGSKEIKPEVEPFKEHWSSVVEVGADLKFYGNVGSPSLYIENITVGG